MLGVRWFFCPPRTAREPPASSLRANTSSLRASASSLRASDCSRPSWLDPIYLICISSTRLGLHGRCPVKDVGEISEWRRTAQSTNQSYVGPMNRSDLTPEIGLIWHKNVGNVDLKFALRVYASLRCLSDVEQNFVRGIGLSSGWWVVALARSASVHSTVTLRCQTDAEHNLLLAVVLASGCQFMLREVMFCVVFSAI